MESKISVTFAGQAGLIIREADGTKLGVDLYLSDCCNRYFGFKRLLPYLFSPMDLNLEYLFATHAHFDHFDPDSIPILMANGKTELICAYDCAPEVKRLNLDSKRIRYIREGDTISVPEFTVTAIPCDHGAETPDAVGLLLNIRGKKIAISGDTAFHQEYFENELIHAPDLFIFPINGAFGNMDEVEGARAAQLVSPKLAIPCHYWNFAEHGGNPALFQKAIGDQPYLLMRPGETIEI